MAKRLQWFPFYGDDWLLSPTVRKMTWEHRGVYLELLCWQWRDGSLPADPETLARMIGATPEAVLEILDAFPLVNASHRANRRLESIRKEQKSLSRKRSKAGAAGAEARWQRHSDGSGKMIQREREKDKERLEPSAQTNTAQSTYQCEVCKQIVVGFVAFAKHQDTHKAGGE